MQAVCPRKELYEAVQIVGRAVSSRTSLPILSQIHVLPLGGGQLRLAATDLELWMVCVLPAQIQMGLTDAPDGDAGFTAPARAFAEMLGTLPDADVTLDRADGGNKVQLRCARANFTLLGLPAEEFPAPPDLDETGALSIKGSVLRDMIRQTIFAVSTDESRPTLTGVLTQVDGDTLKMVATDTHRLAVRTGKLSAMPVVEDADTVEKTPAESPKAIIPARALNELLRLVGDEDIVRIGFAHGQARFEIGSGDKTDRARVTMVTRLIEGTFPNYERVIPTSHNRSLTLERAEFASAVRRVGIVARENANRVVLETEGASIVLTAESSTLGTAREEVEVAREGDDITIAFNAKYLADVLGVVDTEGVSLELSEPLRPGILRPIGGGAVGEDGEPVSEYLCVLMPMQVI